MKKPLHFCLAAAILLFSTLFQFSCDNYKQAGISPDALFNKGDVLRSLYKYDVYVHASDGVFKIQNAHISGDALCEKNCETPIAKENSQHRESINIFTDKPIRNKFSSIKEKVILTKKEIKSIIFPDSLQPKEVNKGGDNDTGIALGLILLIVILGILIIWLLIYLIVQSTNQAAQSSSNGSGSNSNSGGSSGGGGSSSGCYIATMVYGDYDAPQVMTLRKFRDETLSRSAGGRAFIRWYYSWSPGFVKKYSHLNWLHKMIRIVLDGLVKLLS